MNRILLIISIAAILSQQAAGQKIVAWGTEQFGEISSAPNGATFVDAASGRYHSVALKHDGSLHSWGSDSVGQVSGTPAGFGFVQITACGDTSFALTSDGTIVGWGSNAFGQISGIPSGNGFLEVAAGFNHALALRQDGSIISWGQDNAGSVSGPSGATGYSSIAASSYNSMAIKPDGKLSVWGRDFYGEVANTPTNSGWTSIAGGDYHMIALHANGSVLVWGLDITGTVSQAPKESDFIGVAAGENFCVALRADHTIESWGNLIVSTPAGNDFVRVCSGPYSGFAIALEDPDCDGNGILDSQDLINQFGFDCNGNDVLDSCDLASGFSTDVDSDGNLDECVAPPLMADVYELSVSNGGVQTFSLRTPQATGFYFLLGSRSGTSPGISALGLTLPLNQDGYMDFLLANPNSPPLAGSFGVILPNLPGFGGKASAAFVLPSAMSPSFIGQTLHHAYITLGLLDGVPKYTSNAVPLTFGP